MTYKRASVGLIGVLTGLLCFFAILLSTSWGTQLSLYFVRTFTPLQVEYESGALLNDLTLSKLTFDDDKMFINAKSVSLQLHLRCLWKNQVCIDKLSVASLQVNMKEGNATSANEPAAELAPENEPSSFTLPFTIKMKKFFLAKAQIKSQGLTINLTEFSSALSVNNMAINIEKSTLATAHIRLPQAPAAAQPTPTNTPWPLATLPELYSPFKLTLKSLVVKTLNVTEREKTGNEHNVLTIKDAIARLSWFKTQLLIEKLSSTVETVGDFSLKGKLNFVPPYSVDLTLTSAINDVEILPQLNNSTQQVRLEGDLSDLVTTINSQGDLALTAEMSIDVTNADLPYKLVADVTKFTLPNDITTVITPSTLSLQSEGDLNQQVIDLQSNITGFGYQNALLELNAIYAKQIFKINTLHFEESNVNNMLDMTGELQLGNQILWDVKVDSSGITLPNIDPRLSGRVQGSIHSKGFWHDNKWAVSLVDSQVQGEINGIKLSAQANVDINHEGKLAPSQLTLDYGEIALKLAGYSDENWHVSGTANIAKTNNIIKELVASLSSNFSISGPVLQPKLSMQGELKDLLFDELSSDEISFDAQYRPMNNHDHKISFTSTRMKWDTHTINEVNLGSSGDLNQQQVNLAWLGDSAVDLLVNSNYSPSNGQWEIQTDKASLAVDKQEFKPDQQINFLYDNTQKTLALNKHCWLGIGTQLCLNENASLKLTKGELALAITVDTKILKPFIPKDMRLDSSLEGNIAIAWQQDNMPTVDAKLLINKGHIKINKEDGLHTLLAWQKGQLNLQMNNNRVEGSVALFSLDSTEMLSANTSISLTDNRIVDSKVTINDFNLSPLQIFIPELASLEGMLNTTLTVDGNLSNPKIDGEVKITKGKTKILGNINTIENINLAVNFKGHQADVSGGFNLNNVAASLTGDVDWKNELQGQFNFDGESLTFSVPPDLTLTVSPHLIAQINASELKLSGRVEVLDGKLSINKLPQGSVSLSKDVIIVNDEGEQVANEKPFDISTNIRVVITDAVKVEGQGFIGRFGGELQVSQQPHQPLQLFGNLNIPEGRYRAYGQDLSMTKGNISFNGPVNNPFVSVQATRKIEKENIIVGIEATGLANSLNIKLYSKPTMQQSETLSYLVRGRGLDAGTGDSNTAIGVALGTAMTNFSGVLTQIEKLPLLNRLEIDGDDKQASIAGYLGDQVYIKYGIGILEPINELTVRFYLLSRLWVETVSGLENSADIYYSFDIK